MKDRAEVMMSGFSVFGMSSVRYRVSVCISVHGKHNFVENTQTVHTRTKDCFDDKVENYKNMHYAAMHTRVFHVCVTLKLTIYV